MSRLPNPSFAVGATGWTVLTPGCRNVSWWVDADGLTVDATDAVSTPSGSVVVFSPRTPAGPGTWTATVTMHATHPAVVDVAVVGTREVPVPGPPPSAPAYARHHVGARAAEFQASTVLDATARTVGVRISAPAGVRLTISSADVDVDGPNAWGYDEPGGLHVGMSGPSSAFAHGALVGRGAVTEVHVLTLAERTAARLVVDLHDRYHGGASRLIDAAIGAGRVERHRVAIDTSRCGAFAIAVSLTGADGRCLRAQWRYVVDVDDASIAADPRLPWGLTSGTDALDAEGRLLSLLGVAHTRIYSGFAAWDLPAVLEIREARQAQAVVHAASFLGPASGTPAVEAAAAVAEIPCGPAPSGWPRWRDAAELLADADGDHLAPVAALLDVHVGRTVLAEMSQLDDAAAWARVAEAVARGCAGREMAWCAQNEPDLGRRDIAPGSVRARDDAFAAAVRRGDPQCLVVGPMLADGWDGGHQGMTGWDYLSRWLTAGAGDGAGVDAVSVHLHMLDEETRSPEREDLEGLLSRLSQLVASSGSTAQTWITEMGWRSDPVETHDGEPGETGPSVAAPDQADLLVRAAVLAAATGVTRFLGFHLSGFRPTGGGHRFAWGVVDGAYDGPKPAFAALRQLCRMTAGAGDIRLLRTSPRARAAVFTGGERGGVAVVWHWSGGPGLFSLGVPPSPVIVTDALGRTSTGDDLRRPHYVQFAAEDEVHVCQWLSTRLAPRYGETPHAASEPVFFRSHKEMAHVPS